MKDANVGRRGWRWALFGLLGLALVFPASAEVGAWSTHGPEGGSVQAIAIDPHRSSTLYAATSGGGVFKSTDGGEHWTSVNAGLTNLDVDALVVDPAAPAALYAATQGDGVFRSTD